MEKIRLLVAFLTITLLPFSLCIRPASINVLHSTNGYRWEHRGTISFSPMPPTVEGEIYNSVQISQPALSEQMKTALLQNSEIDQFYRIKITIDQGIDIISSVKACALLESQFKDYIRVNFDSTGDILSLNYWTLNSSCSNIQEGHINSFSGSDFVTSVSVYYPYKGHSAEQNVQASIPKPHKNEESSSQDKGTKEEVEEPPKTFWEKYWKYILLGIGYIFITSLLSPNAAQQQQQRAPAQSR